MNTAIQTLIKLSHIKTVSKLLFNPNKQKIFYALAKLNICLLSLFILNGCISNPKGNFTPVSANFNKEYQEQVAKDFAKQLFTLYQSADTTFILTEDLNDHFGKALINNLRELGFAIQEVSNDNVYTTNFSLYATDEEKEQIRLEHKRAKKNPYRHHLKYAVIPVNQDGKSLDELYQVTLYIDSQQRLSRLWHVNFDHLTLQTSLHAGSLWSLANYEKRISN